ncbi:hypothetical protein FGO68_gene8275 [Halteria grandinella]|uniref:Uncharacterized protein n=1 Tax=Halteria grandinella TaxID=5974 RepID=A0A8J8NWV5_HALGN|nr:hypothetical protein FGO68_gene8275 [Halteria grandinella]
MIEVWKTNSTNASVQSITRIWISQKCNIKQGYAFLHRKSFQTDGIIEQYNLSIQPLFFEDYKKQHHQWRFLSNDNVIFKPQVINYIYTNLQKQIIWSQSQFLQICKYI